VRRSTGDRFRRADLAHAADHVLVPGGTFRDVAGSTFRATFHTETGLHAFLDLVLAYPGATSTVTLFLRPRGYRPSGAPEFVPSSLYFDIDQQRAVAAAALLLVDADGLSHQWLSQGDAYVDDLVLVMDPENPDHATFPPESFVPAAALRDAVLAWAFGGTFPPAAIDWRPMTEDEVGWPAGAGY
jgi:hypothetical protein